MSESFVVEHDGPVPVWEQIADDIAAQVADARLKPGARLPAERALVDQYGVAYQTIRRAMEGLREQGLVETRHGKGSFVRLAVAREESGEAEA